MGQIKVLIVDDSRLFRELYTKGLALDPELVVVGAAKDPFEARDLILQHAPDVMLCDVEMPKMDGIEFIRRLLPQYAIPVVMITRDTNNVLKALQAGAADFIAKPLGTSPDEILRFLREVAGKSRLAALRTRKPPDQRRRLEQPFPSTPDRSEAGGGEEEKPPSSIKLIAVGASTGGTEALNQLLQLLTPPIPGMVIVQHIPPVFSYMFAERLNVSTPFAVKEAVHGDWVEPGKVLVAPGDRHMRVRKTGEGYKVECIAGEKVNGHCPSVDVLFHSVAKEAGRHAIGVLLTGMGTDGARGLLAMRNQGARTIGQDEATSAVYGMPKAAFDLGAVEKQAALLQIPSLLQGMVGR